MGGKIVGGAFTASVKPLVQHGRASSKYLGERHSWLSHLQADLEAACRRDSNFGTRGGQQPWQIRCQSPQECYMYCPWPCSSRVFAGVLALLRHGETITCEVINQRKHGKGTSSTSSLRSSYYLFCSKFVSLGPLKYRLVSTSFRLRHCVLCFN